MKLQKVHIALLTNVTEGKVKNEHITLYHSESVLSKTVLGHMEAINSELPANLYHWANRRIPQVFAAWGGDRITSVEIYRRDTEYNSLWEPFKSMSKPHITLKKNQSQEGLVRMARDFPNLNWEHGLLIAECHVGWKIDGEMKYFTENQLKEMVDDDNG